MWNKKCLLQQNLPYKILEKPLSIYCDANFEYIKLYLNIHSHPQKSGFGFHTQNPIFFSFFESFKVFFFSNILQGDLFFSEHFKLL